MMRWIVGSSLRSRGLVLALGIGVLLFGVAQVRDMPRDALPEFGPTTVQIQTEALGLSAEEVEQLITVPLEQDLLNGVAFLDTIRSESVPGMSKIEMIFEPGTDLHKARQVVNERLTQAHALPNVSAPPQMLQPLSSTSRVMMLRVSSKDKSLLDLGLLSRWTIRPQLMGVEGVANVSMWGHHDQQLQVQVDPATLAEDGLTLDEIIRTTGNALWVSPLTFLEASTPGAGGFYDTPSQRIGVEHAQPITSPEALAQVIVDEGPGASLLPEDLTRLGDVTTIVENNQPLIGDAVFADGSNGLLIVVEKLPEANVVEVTNKLEAALDKLAPGLGGVEIDTTYFQPAQYIDESMSNLRNALIIGAVLLVLALGAFLFSLRGAAIALVASLVSMAAAVAVLSFRGESLNAMVLAGLVLALIVVIDDAISSVTSAARSLERTGENGHSAANRLLASVVQSRRPLVYGTVVALIAIAPMLVLTGETGAFLPPIALSYAGAIIASLLVALIVTPVLCITLLGSSAPKTSPVLEWAGPRYERLSAKFTNSVKPGLILGGALLVIGVVALPFLDRGESLIPTLKDRDMLIQWTAAPGTSLTEMRRITARAGEELRSVKGVENVGGHAGRAILGDQTVGVNSSELWVRIDKDADYDGTVKAVEDVVYGYPGITASVLTYGRERINDVLVKSDGVEDKDLTVRTFGYNLDELTTQANRVREAVAGIDGVKDPVVELPVMEPTLEVEVDLTKAQALGIKPGDVRRAAATVLSGITVGNLFQDQKVFDVVVWGTPNVRNSLSSVQDLLISRGDDLPSVRLREVADVRIVPSPNVIRHESVSRSIDVGVDVSGRDVDAVADDIEQAIHSLQYPIEYHAELLGDFRDQQSHQVTFFGVLVAALLSIFLLMQAAFGSWRMAYMAFIALPAALAGGAVAAVIDTDVVTISTAAGFAVVLALAARNIFAFVQRCHEVEDDVDSGVEAGLVQQVAQERFAPVITTAAASLLVLLPMLFFGGQAGHEVVHPMVAVIIGGLVTTTAVSVFVLPSLYVRFGSRSETSREHIELFPSLSTAEPLEPATAPSELRPVDA